MKTPYLNEVLHGDYLMGREDRLSQIFSASFNHSPLFRKATLKFFNIKSFRLLSSLTQQQYFINESPAIIDILITSKNLNFIVIENKVDAPLPRNQLKKYDQIPEIKNCKKYCFIKHYKSISEIRKGWNLCYWGDFYILLISLRKHDFITNNFIEILKEYGMDRPSKIKMTDLQDLVKALYKIRYEDKPGFTYDRPIFETLVDLKRFFTDVFRKASKEPILYKRAGKSFRPKLRVSWWYEDKKLGKEWIWIGCETKLIKPYKKVKSFGAALTLYENDSKYRLVAYVTQIDDFWREQHVDYPKKDLNCSEFENMAIEYWNKVLK